MTTETVLGPQQILHLWDTRVNEPNEKHPLVDGDKLRFARAIEQAVLQSPEVQRLREDAARIDWLEASLEPHGFCHTGHGDYRFYAHQQTGFKAVREVIDAAMERQL